MSDSPNPSVLSSPVAFAQGIAANSYEQMETLVHNVISLRREFFARYLDPRRNIDKECGFPDSLSAEQYWELYQRDAIAARVVECVPRAVWQRQPTIYEDENAEVDTPFEQAWDGLGKTLNGERSYYESESGNAVMSVLERADILSGIGQYGVILLGLDDGLDLREPVRGVVEKFSMPAKVTKKRPMPRSKAGADGATTTDEAEPPKGRKPTGTYSLNWSGPDPLPGARFNVTTNAYVQPKRPSEYEGRDEYETFPKDPTEAEEPESDLDGTDGDEGATDDPKAPCRKLLYLRAFSEASAQITHYETNPTCPRYGQPTQYLITFNDSREQSWQGMRTMAPQHQRQVHWTRIVHVPSDGRLSSDVFGTERLRQVYRHILTLQKLYHGDGEMYWKGAFPGISFETHPQLGGQVDVDQTGVRGQIEQYQNGLQRFLLSMGMTAKMLSPTVVDPTPHIEIQLTAIAIRIGIPKRVLMGSERGELASSQDAGEWDDVVSALQVNDRNPRLIAPLVDRLINVSVLPEPCGYSVEWPEIDTTGEVERSQIALTLTQAMVSYLQGNGPSFMAPLDYLTRVWGMEEEEAQSIIDNAEAIAEQLKAEQEEEMLAQMDMQEEQLNRGLVADPNDPELIPDQVGGGAPPFGGGGPPNGKPKSPAFNMHVVRNGICINCGGKGGKPGPCPTPWDNEQPSNLPLPKVGQETIYEGRKWKVEEVGKSKVSGEAYIILGAGNLGAYITPEEFHSGKRKPRKKFMWKPGDKLEVDEYDTSKTYKVSKQAASLLNSTDWKSSWGGDLVTAADGKRRGAFTTVSAVSSGKPPKATEIQAAFNKHGLSAKVIQGKYGVAVVHGASLKHPEAKRFIGLAKKYLSGETRLASFTPEEHRLLGRWLGYSKKSTEKYLSDPVLNGEPPGGRFPPKGPPKPELNGASKIVKNIAWKRKERNGKGVKRG